MTDYSFEDPRDVLARHRLGAKRRFSQNFLISEPTVRAIARAVDLKPGERCVELGPGLGTLTRALVASGVPVTGIERDPDMLHVLHKELTDHPNFHVVDGDAAQLDVQGLLGPGGPVVVVGNLPYAITGMIARRLVDQCANVARVVVMVQREVAERWLAHPGERAYGAPTVFLSAVYAIDHVLDVPRGAFHPAPKVESAVVQLTPRAEPRAEETPTLQAVVKAAFHQRRKTLRNALRPLFTDTDTLDRALDMAEVDGRRRGETLSVEEFARIAAHL
ncbi:MAG: 16S rRNA (adenine(1518)-N(6)/adenine(1519)-N(6))-dimethyltransferase RsmA [Polyangiales bacterium]|nr:ribosomal RNA small subunit methyltransferase A [Myxococcales bacterium]MCB9658983.1 ribosomal RNA small subunit methyltransferase A [Sandaracinaceae bacterium]